MRSANCRLQLFKRNWHAKGGLQLKGNVQCSPFPASTKENLVQENLEVRQCLSLHPTPPGPANGSKSIWKTSSTFHNVSEQPQQEQKPPKAHHHRFCMLLPEGLRSATSGPFHFTPLLLHDHLEWPTTLIKRTRRNPYLAPDQAPLGDEILAA